MDTAGSNRDIGMVRARADDSMEEHVPIAGDKQETGVSAIERRSLEHNSKSMVEVPDRQTIHANSIADKLKATSNRIKCVELRKISVRSKGGMVTTSDHCEENLARQTDGRLDDRQPIPGKNDSICRG